MNNKTMLFMAEFHEAMVEFISMDVGKSVKADLKAIEKAHGGVKKLAEADKILADSRKVYDQRVAAGNEETRRVLRMADDKIKDEVQALVKKEADLAKLKDDLSRQNTAAVETTRKLKESVKAVGAREIAVKRGEDANWTKERNLKAMETRLTAQKAEQDTRAARFKEAAA